MEIKEEIWTLVTTVISAYTTKDVLPEKINVTDSIINYFPCENPKDINDKYAHLFSDTLCEVLEQINLNYKLNLKFDFLFRQEWDLFKTVGHIFMYFIYLIEDRKE